MSGIARWQGRGLATTLGLLLAVGSLKAQDDGRPAYSLQEAIAVALENNRELQDARLSLRSANEQVREAWGSILPTIDASVSYQRNLRVQASCPPSASIPRHRRTS